jgi:hypothetical protein
MVRTPWSRGRSTGFVCPSGSYALGPVVRRESARERTSQLDLRPEATPLLDSAFVPHSSRERPGDVKKNGPDSQRRFYNEAKVMARTDWLEGVDPREEQRSAWLRSPS